LEIEKALEDENEKIIKKATQAWVAFEEQLALT
jgi:hypothetical protein